MFDSTLLCPKLFIAFHPSSLVSPKPTSSPSQYKIIPFRYSERPYPADKCASPISQLRLQSTSRRSSSFCKFGKLCLFKNNSLVAMAKYESYIKVQLEEGVKLDKFLGLLFLKVKLEQRKAASVAG